jgi:hypothetical protein
MSEDDKQPVEHKDAAAADANAEHTGWARHADDLSGSSAEHKQSSMSEDDKQPVEHKDAATADANAEHTGWARHADDSTSPSDAHKPFNTSKDPAFEHKNVATAASNPEHPGQARHGDDPLSPSVEHKLSDASDDNGAGRSHQSLSPIATADLSDDGTPDAHPAHGHGGSAPQLIQLSSEAAPLPPSEIAADGAPHDSAPPSSRGLGHLAASDASGHASDPLSVHPDAVPPTAADPLPSYMASLTTDQFQFSDLNTHSAHKVGHGADVIATPPTTQMLVEATTPVDHSASLHDIGAIPGTELLVSHSHQAAAHAHNGLV